MKQLLVQSLTWIVVVANGHVRPTVLLKQAVEDLVLEPLNLAPAQFTGDIDRMDNPGPADLLLSRLQVDLATRVEDNWEAINNQQRWAILNSKGPETQILKSFLTIEEGVTEMEASVRQSRAEEMLNNLELPAAVMIEWSRYWDTVRKEVGQINSLYRYFEGYVKNPLEAKKAVLEDFATSVSGTVSFRDSSLQKMMDTLHNKTMRNGDKTLFKVLIYL